MAQVAVRYTASGADGKKRRLCSHNLVFFALSPAAACLPRDIAPEEQMVVFCELNDNKIRAQTKKRLIVRRVVTEHLLREYRGAMVLYREVPDNEGYFAEGEYEKILTDNYHDDGTESTIIKETKEARDRPGRVQLMDAAEAATSAGYYGSADTESPTELLCFRVTRSSELMNHRSRDYDLAAFPDLHSNGLGAVYDHKRAAHASAPEARRHLAALSNRGHAQHELWSLVNFANENKDKGQGPMTVRLDYDAKLASAAFNVTEEELNAQLQYQRQK